jgi:hypothetical protein
VSKREESERECLRGIEVEREKRKGENSEKKHDKGRKKEIKFYFFNRLGGHGAGK